jgi:cytochrome P450
MRLPGPRGPLAQARVGAALSRAPAEGLRRLHASYGPVVAFGYRPFRYVAMFGADANRYILAENPENFRWREALRSLIAVDGDTALVVSDGEDHQRRRRVVQAAFAIRRVRGYVDVMVDEIDRELDTWRPGEIRDVSASLRRVIRRIAVRSLFGEALGHRADELGEALGAAIAFVNRPITRQAKLNLPGTAWHRAKAARDRADEIINAEVRRRRNATAGPGAPDLLDVLLGATDEENGAQLSGVEVRDQVVSLVAAGYDTTSAAAGWAVHELLANEGEWDIAANEIVNVVGDDALNLRHLAAMPHLDAVVHEILRLWPPGFVSARKAVSDFAFAGYTIPGGSIVLYSPYVTHRDATSWREPDRFRPDRWADTEPVPYSFVPFGGGTRHCIGFAFATQELKVILAQLLRRVALTRRSTAPVIPIGTVALHPKRGVPARVERIAARQ